MQVCPTTKLTCLYAHTGFGLPMSLSTVALSFYVGAAVLAVLFPLYILVAADSDPDLAHNRVGPLPCTHTHMLTHTCSHAQTHAYTHKHTHPHPHTHARTS